MLLQRFGTGDWKFCIDKLAKTRMADASQIMKDRIARQKIGDNEHVSSGAWTSEAFPVVDGQRYGVRAELNPFMIPEYAEQAVEAHRQCKEFYLDNVKLNGKPLRDLILRAADEDAKKPVHLRRVLKLTEQEGYDVSSLKLGEKEVPIWLARGQKSAEKYGKILPTYNISNVHVYLAPTNSGNVVRATWLGRLGGNNQSYFDCVNRDLFNDVGSVFGGFVSAEGTRAKISEPKVRVFIPSFSEVKKYAQKFVPQIARNEFEKGLKTLYQDRKR